MNVKTLVFAAFLFTGFSTPCFALGIKAYGALAAISVAAGLVECVGGVSLFLNKTPQISKAVAVAHLFHVGASIFAPMVSRTNFEDDFYDQDLDVEPKFVLLVGNGALSLAMAGVAINKFPRWVKDIFSVASVCVGTANLHLSARAITEFIAR